MQVKQLLKEYQTILQQPQGWLKAPLWTLALATGAKSFVDNPVLGNSVFNQAGLHLWRVKLAARLAARRRARLSKSLTAEDARFFNQYGFIVKEDFLPADDFARLEQELLGTELPARETLQGNTVTRRIPLDYQTLPQLPNTQQLIAQPELQHLLNYVGSFQVQPMLYIQSILSQVRKAKADPQTKLHADTFHSSVKAWLFLTDVAEDEGPFVYVPGSHQLTPARLDWEKQRSINAARADRMSARGSFRISEAELEQLGLPKPKAFAVKKNTLVVADTFGFHARGKSVRPSTRIEVWAYARRNPFLPWTGFDPLALPFLKDKIIPLYWWALDELEKRQWRKNPWRSVGRLRAGDPPRFIKK
ncbi:phytanoyl-CoA dioxygenase family protein [Alkanindiges illinoisensis]|uniref:phytanoyl-CoA dioxygenase family protein n=1 Tax=Alkanindiges illinoisensis TaxID=197183 RepID=UPI0005583C3C|nr:phytanoyl-CoA dioxygenase family protein [Alkanindiges illinoisensis]